MFSQTSNLLVLKKFMKTFLERNGNLIDDTLTDGDSEIFDSLFVYLLSKVQEANINIEKNKLSNEFKFLIKNIFIQYQKENNIEFSIANLEALRKLFNFKYQSFYYFTVDLLKTISFLSVEDKELSINQEVFQKLYQTTYVYVNGLYYLIKDNSNINDEEIINQDDLSYLSNEFDVNDITVLYQGYNYLSNISYGALDYLISTTDSYGITADDKIIDKFRDLFINVLKLNTVKVSPHIKKNKLATIEYFSNRQALYFSVFLTLEEEYKKYLKENESKIKQFANLLNKSLKNNKNIIDYQCVELFDNINALILEAPKSLDYEKTGKEAAKDIINLLNNDLSTEKFFIILDNYKKLSMVSSKILEFLSTNYSK